MENHASITFYGGTGTVTGANFLFDTGDGTRILIDCGAYEREHVCDPANVAAFPYDPASIGALIVTHAHADHIGRIPKLVREGFKGAIYSTSATKDLAAVMFDDALSIMRSHGERRDCAPLYEQRDTQAALALWRGCEYHEPFEIGPAVVELFDAGHILGSAMIKLTRNSRGVLFTGDLGNSPEPLLNDTENPGGVQYLVIESVYGDRVHEGRERRRAILRAAVEGVRERAAALLIPAFSLERTQIMLFEISEMVAEGTLAPLPIFLDSPLAARATEIFRRHLDLLNPEARRRFAHGNDAFAFPGLRVTATSAQARAIHDSPDPKVIIAGAGMSVGGRIRGHEAKYLPDPKAAILFVGYQTPGSLGRRIQDGEREVSIDSKRVPVRAQVQTLIGYSGHKDRDGLLDFVGRLGPTLKRVFVVMGEPKSEMFLAQRIRDFLGVDAAVPRAGQTVAIEW